MKLIVAICRSEDAPRVSDALVAREFRVTRVATTGGFLKRGNTTLLVGVEAGEVDIVVEMLRKTLGPAPEPGQRRATVFVLDAAKYEQV
jgi:uncharacterized protein YaaQ